MTINLKKKQPFDLTKRDPGLRRIAAGLGWDVSQVNGKAVDCDVSVFMLGADNKIPGERYFVFYNNLQSEDGAVQHMGDSREGVGDGDDEVIELDLPRVSADIAQILFIVTIHESEERGHHFGHVTNAFIRIYNRANDAELCRFTLTDRFDGSDSLLIGRLYRSGAEWEFEPIGDAFGGGLAALVDIYT